MPIKQVMTYPVVETNTAWFKKQIETMLDKAVEDAVRIWLTTILNKMPTYTGTARGTFVPVGRLVNRTIAHGAISARASQKKYVRWGNKKFKTGFSQGANYATAKLTKRVGSRHVLYKFLYENILPYVLWNDTHSPPPNFTMPSNPPWDVLDPATDFAIAFLRHDMRKKLARLKMNFSVSYRRSK